MSQELWAKIHDLERRNRAIESADLTADELLSAAMFLSLPGLRGFWPMSSFNEAGNAYDLSGQGRTLTNVSTSLYNYDALAPYIEFDGTADYLRRADEAGLDILGTEAYINATARGLTLGGWFWVDDTTGAAQTFMSKLSGGGVNRSYFLVYLDPATRIQFGVEATGGAGVTVATSVATVSFQSWYFLVGRFDTPNHTVWVNDVALTVGGGPVGINSSGANFEIGAWQGVNDLLDGRASLCFLCAAALSDATVMSLFHQTRAIYGV